MHRLLAASAAYFDRLYPVESNHYVGADTLGLAEVYFLVARLDGGAVGCGALVPDDRGWGEIKSMFVDEWARGRGIARGIMAALEAEARRRRFALLRLEAGVHQPDALALYRGAGFEQIGRFGGYPDDPLSVFMEKRLG